MQEALSEKLAFRLWPQLVKLDKERRDYKTPEVLIRIQNDCLVATTKLRGMPIAAPETPPAGQP